jgi:hypothetical protein
MTRLIDGFHVSADLLSCLASCLDDFSHRYQKINDTAGNLSLFCFTVMLKQNSRKVQANFKQGSSKNSKNGLKRLFITTKFAISRVFVPHIINAPEKALLTNNYRFFNINSTDQIYLLSIIDYLLSIVYDTHNVFYSLLYFSPAKFSSQ